MRIQRKYIDWKIRLLKVERELEEVKRLIRVE
jgi:hypothetical protein